MLTPTGIITPVRVNELIPRECFCMLYAQRVNLFGMRVVLCLRPAPYIMIFNIGISPLRIMILNYKEF
jgi:hypothetical protein